MLHLARSRDLLHAPDAHDEYFRSHRHQSHTVAPDIKCFSSSLVYVAFVIHHLRLQLKGLSKLLDDFGKTKNKSYKHICTTRRMHASTLGSRKIIIKLHDTSLLHLLVGLCAKTRIWRFPVTLRTHIICVLLITQKN